MRENECLCFGRKRIVIYYKKIIYEETNWEDIDQFYNIFKKDLLLANGWLNQEELSKEEQMIILWQTYLTFGNDDFGMALL